MNIKEFDEMESIDKNTDYKIEIERKNNMFKVNPINATVMNLIDATACMVEECTSYLQNKEDIENLKILIDKAIEEGKKRKRK